MQSWAHVTLVTLENFLRKSLLNVSLKTRLFRAARPVLWLLTNGEVCFVREWLLTNKVNICHFTLSPGYVQSIAISVSVCLNSHVWKPHLKTSQNFLHIAWLSPPLMTVQYVTCFQSCRQCHVSHNRAYVVNSSMTPLVGPRAVSKWISV